MKIAVFDTHDYERKVFKAHQENFTHEVIYHDVRLNEQTVSLANGCEVICGFVNDHFDEPSLKAFAKAGGKLIALRCAGFNNVDLAAAARCGIHVVRVPAYSPHAVAEFAMALILTLNRKTHRAYNRVREGNFSLEGLTGFDLHGKTVGIVGVGVIGAVFAKIVNGFGCKVLGFDPDIRNIQNAGTPISSVSLDELCRNADIISLHAPLNPKTKHMINAERLALMKPSAMIINTGRGALIDAQALIVALKRGMIGAAALDVYEEEEGVFFSDHSGDIMQDDVLARLISFPNVLITSHQAFLTNEALNNIVSTTFESISAFEKGLPLTHEIKAAA